MRNVCPQRDRTVNIKELVIFCHAMGFVLYNKPIMFFNE